ncbi:MAG: hypothetical protein EXX96DRAFT_233645 [Benjaminiella poitrasii]|nr:MAG: hypothetical protein EXX96DRAFT_233645 [Benjaminiella poitrasii]
MTKEKGRIINITHQIPYEITLTDNKEDPWQLAPRRGHGAMYGGVDSLQKSGNWKVLYIGWTGHIMKQQRQQQQLQQQRQQQQQQQQQQQIQSYINSNSTTLEPVDYNQLKDTEKEKLKHKLKALGCLPLFIDGESVAGHYDGYCKTSKIPSYFLLYMLITQ